MKTTYQDVTKTGPGVPIPIYTGPTGWGSGMGVIAVLAPGTTAAYTVELSGDPVPINDADLVNNPPQHWLPHHQLVGQGSSGGSILAFPVTMVRLNVASLSNGGSIRFAIVQTI